MLWDLAINLEKCIYEHDAHRAQQVDFSLWPIMEMFEQAAHWFYCLSWLPYDATFRLEALLDCLVFFMGDEYGKYQLDCCYQIELLQLGFGFGNMSGRK